MRKILLTLAFAIALQIPLTYHRLPQKTADGGSIGTYIKILEPVKPLASVHFDSFTQLSQVEVASVAPVASAPVSHNAPGGCVTGYVSGDYYLDKIIQFESSGISCNENAGGCFGLLQACPGAPLKAACGGEPACQIEWFRTNKAGGRSWATIWQHELDYGWW